MPSCCHFAVIVWLSSVHLLSGYHWVIGWGLPNPSFTQYLSELHCILCPRWIMPCPPLFTATLQKSALNIHICSFIWLKLGSLCYSLFTMYVWVDPSSSCEQLKEMALKRVQWVLFPYQAFWKILSKLWSVAVNGVGTLVCYSCHGNLDLMLHNICVSDFKQRNLAFDGITQF